MVFWVTLSILISPQLRLLSLVTNGKTIFETSSSSQLPTCLRQRDKNELKIYSRLEIKVNCYWRILPTQHVPLDSFQVLYDITPDTTTSLNVIILALQIMKMGLEEFIHWFEFNIKSLLATKCKVPPHKGKQTRQETLAGLNFMYIKGNRLKRCFFSKQNNQCWSVWRHLICSFWALSSVPNSQVIWQTTSKLVQDCNDISLSQI